MNPEIKQYWENQGHKILCQEEPSGEITNTPIYYYFLSGCGPKVFVAAKWSDNDYLYWLYPNWHFEEDMLKLIGK